ncbi:hypothetical protein P8452_52337 [Trifolium repens]|nr:hypothetical protein P8452_52337 [Trifolium repens]
MKKKKKSDTAETVAGSTSSVSPINGMDMWPKPAEGVEENGIRKRIKGRKPPKGKTKQGETQATAPAQATATASAQATVSQSLFDDISDEVMSSIPDIIADFIPNKNKSEAGKDNAVKDNICFGT